MSKQPSPWLRRVGSAALFATLGATIIGFGVAGAVDGGSSSTSSTTPSAAEAAPHHGRGLNLTDTQKTCLTEAGITKPEGRPTQAERDAFKAAAETCGITLPTRPENAGGRLNLTDTQKTCLTEAGITKPAEGTKPTQAERDAFKAAAETCGITPPARPSAEPGLGAPDEAPGMGGRFGDGHGPGGRFGRGPGDGDHFDGPGPSGPAGTNGAPVEPTSGS
ncbi:MAG: hypothetical protein F2877_06560 [Actinobacteria bacterium]|uniref:Unannotated protein n=1 Tax=freshwater metagenome TaxID=449393 RepID=A0A6J7NZP2_9ZZZZ|nr:hypothetical protein [Actinomycetota bacterium]